MREKPILLTLILLFFWLAVSSLVHDSPTMDEQNHIGRGVAFTRTGDPRLSMEHPPLVNGLSAIPTLIVRDLRLPLDDPSWQREPIEIFWYIFGEKLLWEYNPDRVDQLVFLARLPIVWLTIGLALVARAFSAELWHKRAGFFAAALILFDPNIIAHGRYSTTDMGGTAFLILATYALWRMWNGRLSIPLTAIALGMAFTSKLSILGFVPVFAVLAMLPFYETWSGRLAVRRLVNYLVAGVLSIGVVWAIFGFEWGNFLFIGDDFQQFNKWSGPMPTFWAGIERIAVATGGGRRAYLLGNFSENGFANYFPIAFLVKTPLTTLLLIVCAFVYLMGNRRKRLRSYFLVVPALYYFGTTTQSGLNIGYRHLLPMLAMLYIWMSGFMPEKLRRNNAMTLRGFVSIFVLAGALGTALFAHPGYIGYFNEIVGRKNGWQVLGDSNIDWGQDLHRLNHWMEENDVERVKLSYFGSVEPARYLTYDPLPGDPRHRDLWWNVPFDRTNPEPGVYAISVHNLLEMPLNEPEKTVFAWFREREPDERVGAYHIYIVEK